MPNTTLLKTLPDCSTPSSMRSCAGDPQKFYTDNGKPFVSQHLQQVCARLGIQLLHAKPYAAYSKGKIERFFRTLQEQV